MLQHSLSTTFGQTVRLQRKTVGLTQEELADLAEIHPTYVGLVERGERNPSLDVAARIADALGFTLAELIAPAESGRIASGQNKGKRR